MNIYTAKTVTSFYSRHFKMLRKFIGNTSVRRITWQTRQTCLKSKREGFRAYIMQLPRRLYPLPVSSSVIQMWSIALGTWIVAQCHVVPCLWHPCAKHQSIAWQRGLEWFKLQPSSSNWGNWFTGETACCSLLCYLYCGSFLLPLLPFSFVIQWKENHHSPCVYRSILKVGLTCMFYSWCLALVALQEKSPF